jgi:ATP-dependent DNA ligase
MKLKFVDELPKDLTNKIYQLKVDGGNAIIDVELPNIKIYHARDDVWHLRTYQYPDLVTDIRNGALQDHTTNIGEVTVFDENGIGRRHLLGHRLCENPFQINRVTKLYPARFYPHHIVRDREEQLFHLTYEQQLRLLDKMVKPTEHIIQIPTYKTPDDLLKQKGTGIEGIVVKDLNAVYLRGKTSDSMLKYKFLKETVVKFISYEEKDVGFNFFTDDNIEIHEANQRQISIAVANIDEKGMVRAEITYLERTERGFLRDARIKRLLTDRKEEL